MTYARLFRSFFVLAALVGLFAGCAEERDPIDRVQPNYVDKSLLDGEWYYQRTVTEMPAANGFTFVGSTDFNGLTRVTWDVQENFLYARRTTELLRGGDLAELEGSGYEGEVVAAFRIERHFDIAYAYNPTTGERLNIREENATDRPWYERSFMRVDWSQNMVTNYTLDFETASVEPVPYFVQEFDDATGERNPDAPHFEEDGTYFDVTNKLFARAGTVELPGYGEIPTCWLRGEETTECGAGEYTIRHSFMQVDPDRQYEPLAFKGEETELFGFFWTDRLVYDEWEGITEQRRERYLNRYNMWEQWRDESGAEIPVAQRTLRPITYHVNKDFPDDLVPVAERVAAQWNDVFRDVVAAQGYPLRDDEQVFVLCSNWPVAEGDHPSCGEPGDMPRIGDIRYSFMAYVPRYMEYGLLGLGPSNNDPETGEILSGVGYVYHHNNLAAFRTTQMVELLNGSRAADDFIDGVDLSSWIDLVRGESERPSRLHGLEDAEHMAHSIAHGPLAAYWEGQRAMPSEEDLQVQLEEGFDEWVEPYLEDMYRRGLFNGEAESASGRMRALEDTYIEDLLIDEEVLLASGWAPGQGDPTDAHIEQASILRGGFGNLAVERARLRTEFAASRNMYLPEMADDGLMGLAIELKDTPTEEAYRIIRESIYTAVLAHEVGHALGLMHNFGGSDDAINYFDEYWTIRDDGDVGPRLVDPISDTEVEAGIYNEAYSSVMDYAGRLTIDGNGVGKYDRAAILFGYAQQMEVFRDTGGMSESELANWFSQDGDVLLFAGTGPSSIHYTTFYNRMGDLLYRDDNRELVSVDAFEGDYSGVTVDGERLARVPYIYCSHNRADLGDNCLTRDFGADPYERMYNLLDGLDTWYITRSFPRGQVGVDNYSYVSRNYPRVYHRLKQWHDLYGLYVGLFARFFPPSMTEAFLTDPINGWGAKTWGVQNAFNYLIQTILMPNVGEYAGPVPQPDGSVMMMSGYTPATLDVDVTEGRYFSTSWGDGDRECGYMWYECLHHIGFYLDKIMAIEALSDTRTNFVARATPEDLRQWEVSYYNTFSDQIEAINEAIIAQDYSRIAPYSEDGQLYWPNYTGDLRSGGTNQLPVDPLATFSVQLYWQVLGLARFPMNFDRSFVEDSTVFRVGTGAAPDLDPDRLVTVYDPDSGITWGAIRGEDASTAAESMIERANVLISFSDICDDAGDTAATEDDCQDLPGQFGQFYSKAQVSQRYRDYMQLVRVMADMRTRMGFRSPYDL